MKTPDRQLGILHVSDFHVREPESEYELLRKRFFREYVRRLKHSLAAYGDVINAIVATGDFVDKGKVENFQHAATVLNELALSFGVPAEKVFVCTGNHDIDRSLDATGDENGAREAYREFASKFGNSTAVGDAFAQLVRPTDDVALLLLDATLGAHGQNRPAVLTPRVRDDVMDLITSKVSDSDQLILAAHYPIYPASSPPHSAWAENNADWHAHHGWYSAVPLVDRIANWRRGHDTLILFGDIHQEHHTAIEDGAIRHIHVGSGRFGTCEHDSQIRRQANVIRMHGDVQLVVAEWEMNTHPGQSELGEWRCTDKGMTRINRAFAVGSSISPAITEPGPDVQILPPQEAAPAGVVPEPQRTTGMVGVELIDAVLERTLIRTITDKRLYHLGRFRTIADEVTLGWVTIGPLLNTGVNLIEVIERIAEWAIRRTQQLNVAERLVIIGIDAWGAAIGTQVGLMLNAFSFCVGTRGGNHNYVINELVNKELLDRIRSATAVLLVTDAVGSGRSLRSLYDEIAAQLGIDPEGVTWLAASILCDSLQFPKPALGFLTAHGTCCSALRMPRVPVDMIPPETIVPPILSFG